MKIWFLTFGLFLLISSATSQERVRDSYMSISGGRVSFGSGDFIGYFLSIGVSKNLLKQSLPGIKRLLVGADLIFENGVKNPVIQNPSIGEFLTNFYHVSSSIVWAKISYYPFRKIVRGFNVQAGPTFGHSYRSTEARAIRQVNSLGQATRLSQLTFDNGFTVGYQVGVGMEWPVTDWLTGGLRADFSNNSSAEINTLLGLRFEFRL